MERTEILKAEADLNVGELSRFIGGLQKRAMRHGLRGEEGAFFADKISEYKERIASMPTTYEQNGKGDESVCYLHYFMGNSDWFVVEKDMEGGVDQAMAFCSVRGGWAKFRYTSITEITKYGAELDLHFTPKTVGEVKKEYGYDKDSLSPGL